MGQPLDRVARNRGVCRNDGVEAVAPHRIGNDADLFVVEVGRDLERNRHQALRLLGQRIAARAQGAEQLVEFIGRLQLAQVLGVGRTDVDRDVAGVGVDAVEAVQVIVDRAFDRSVGVLADVQAEDAALGVKARALHIGNEGIDAAVVETHAIDDRVGRGQPEHARAWVARLRARRHGADFEKTEAEVGQRVDVAPVLVQSGGQSDRVRKAQSHHGPGLVPGPMAERCEVQAVQRRQRTHGQVMRGLGIELEQQGADQGIKRHGKRDDRQV